MAWGEVHALTGLAIHHAANGNYAVAVPLAVLSHWPLDDLNVGKVAMIYHGTGKGWQKILTALARLPIIGFIAYSCWVAPAGIPCCLLAWLALDHEWIVGGYGLHAHMWPKWIKDERGLAPWFIVMGLLCWLIWSALH